MTPYAHSIFVTWIRNFCAIGTYLITGLLHKIQMFALLTPYTNLLFIRRIYHQNSDPFPLGPCLGLDPEWECFALFIPTCWYLKPSGTNANHHKPKPNPNRPNVSPSMSRWSMVTLCPLTLGFALGMLISSCLCTFSMC